MTILVLGATGTVGTHVVRKLLSRNETVRVLSRRETARQSFPNTVEFAMGDLLDPATAAKAFDGVHAVFLLNAVSPTESHEALAALNHARDAGVSRIVYLSVHKVDNAPTIPHWGAKIGVEAALASSRIPFTVLRANHFFQNDLWAEQAMRTHGIYNQPIGGIGLSRVDAHDIAEAAAITLTTPGHEGKFYDLVGPEVLTGDSTAAIWSRAFGRPVRYAGDDLIAWQRANAGHLPPWMVFDLVKMHEYFQHDGLVASPEAIATLTRLLGRPPRSLAQFAAETTHARQARPHSAG